MIREMTINDHGLVIELFDNTPGVTVREADSLENTKGYLERNPNLNGLNVKELLFGLRAHIFEEENSPIALPDLIEAIRFCMKQQKSSLSKMFTHL